MSDLRRFAEGDTFSIPPFQYRVVRGRKGPDDLRLDWRWVTDWRPVELDHAFLQVDMIAENENFLYPNGAGGGYVLRYLKKAMQMGWAQARHDLHQERSNKADRWSA